MQSFVQITTSMKSSYMFDLNKTCDFAYLHPEVATFMLLRIIHILFIMDPKSSHAEFNRIYLLNFQRK